MEQCNEIHTIKYTQELSDQMVVLLAITKTESKAINRSFSAAIILFLDQQCLLIISSLLGT
jgi:hypothetical protein